MRGRSVLPASHRMRHVLRPFASTSTSRFALHRDAALETFTRLDVSRFDATTLYVRNGLCHFDTLDWVLFDAGVKSLTSASENLASTSFLREGLDAPAAKLTCERIARCQ